MTEAMVRMTLPEPRRRADFVHPNAETVADGMGRATPDSPGKGPSEASEIVLLSAMGMARRIAAATGVAPRSSPLGGWQSDSPLAISQGARNLQHGHIGAVTHASLSKVARSGRHLR